MPASAATEDGAGAGHAADRVQGLVGARIGVAGDEDEGEVGAVRPAALDRFERGLERRVVGRFPDGETCSRGEHDYPDTRMTTLPTDRPVSKCANA